MLSLMLGQGAGQNQTIFKDDECNGYALISKSYVRYAVRVKAGKSYWVFQNNSKPQFSGFAFVPDGFDGAPQTTMDRTCGSNHQ